jgi:hypothetical protein
MSGEQGTTQQMDRSQENSVSPPHTQQRKIKLALLLASIAFSAAAFLTLDWFRSAAILRRTKSNAMPSSCRLPDPVRHHAFKPNCASIHQWGGDTYEFFTNSLGFRDEKIREVPLADTRPRILILGDSFTEGMIAWRDSYVGRIAAHFPQCDFLNGGVLSYSPSNYLNTARIVLAAGVEFDEVLVFIDISDVQDEAAFYRDADASGSVTGPARRREVSSWYATWRLRLAKYLVLTSYLYGLVERFLVGHGYYHLPRGWFGDTFDSERSAWTYRKVNETDPYMAGYAPFGVEGGIAKETAKMTLLWRELQKRNIPISVVVYPYPAQLVHDTADSRQVRIWREWCVGKCKRFISLFPAFFAVKGACSRLQPGCWYLNYFVFGDTHYNAAGNALVADAVANSLAEDPPRKVQPKVSGATP